jgi:hypothetical protein
MKHALLVIVLFFWAFSHTKAQIPIPTNREIFNFSVGDTFVYETAYFNGACYCYPPVYYMAVVTGKRFSLNNDTVFYNYNSDNYGPEINASYTNLDSSVLSSPYIPLFSPSGGVDTVYIDSSTFCNPLSVAYYESGLAFQYGWAVGLGMVKDAFYAQQGDANSEFDHGNSLIYFSKSGVSCGSYNSNLLVNSIALIELGKRVQLFPNPSTNLLNISGLIENEPYSVFDETGRLCQSGLCQSQIPVDKLSGGIYFIKIGIEGNEIFQRFIKQ